MRERLADLTCFGIGPGSWIEKRGIDMLYIWNWVQTCLVRSSQFICFIITGCWMRICWTCHLIVLQSMRFHIIQIRHFFLVWPVWLRNLFHKAGIKPESECSLCGVFVFCWLTDVLFTPHFLELFLASIILHFLHVLAYIVRLYFHMGSVSNWSLAKHLFSSQWNTFMASLVTFGGRFVAGSVLSRPHFPQGYNARDCSYPILCIIELSATIFRVSELLPRRTWPEPL